VLEAVIILAKEFVSLPCNQCSYEVQCNPRFYLVFKPVLGGMEGTHIAAHVSKLYFTPYHNCKEQITKMYLLHTRLVCTFAISYLVGRV